MDTDSAPQSGKHRIHISSGSICDDCHGRYAGDRHHKDGTVDGRNSSVDIVLFNNKHLATKWDKSTENCSSISCHGGGTVQVNWYGSGSGCQACHSAGSIYDPVTTNGEGVKGKHKLHTAKVACEVCHYNYKIEPTHMNGVYGIVEAVNIVAKDMSETFIFDAGTGRCSNIKCHGNPAGFNWYTAASGSCTDCHAPGSSFDPNISGNHDKHSNGIGYECGKCHNGYSGSGTHVNGTVDKPAAVPGIINFDNTNPGGTYAGSNTCANLACHGGGTPVWGGGAIPCIGCHTSGSIINPLITSGSGASGKHIPHFTDKAIKCEVCHENYNKKPSHGNGLYGKKESSTLMVFDSDGTYGWPNPGNGIAVAFFNDATGTCGIISCHKNTNANWYMDVTGCAGCHSPDSDIDPMKTNGSGASGKHTVHVTIKGIDCIICHYNYTGLTTHINNNYGRTEITSMTPSGLWPGAGFTVAFNYNDKTNSNDAACGNISCHGKDYGVTGEFDWYASASNCINCHTPGSGIDPFATGNHGKHAGTGAEEKNYDCVKCHNNYSSQASHTNGVIDNPSTASGMVSFDSINPSGTYTDVVDSCAGLYCHGGGIPSWGGGPIIACTDCHTAGSSIDPLTTGGSGDKGKHSTHTTSKSIPCTGCHFEYNKSSNHGNGNYGKTDIAQADIKSTGSWGGNVIAMSFADASGGCDAISCHGNAGGVSWYSSATIGCMTCHASPSITPQPGTISGDNHKTHIDKSIDCNNCHFNYKLNANHMNGSSETPGVNFGGTYKGYTVSDTDAYGTAGAGKCSNIVCHGTKSVAGTNPVGWKTTAALACTDCHNSNSQINPTTVNHNKHINDLGYACTDCHSNYKSSNNHINGIDDTYATNNGIVNFSGINPGGEYNGTTCGKLYCHGGSSSAVNWGGSALGCGTCHGNPPGTGAHAKHSVSPYSYGCVKCHDDGNGVGSNHHSLWKVDGIKTVAFDSLADRGNNGAAPLNALYNSVTSVCSNTYCHGDFTDGKSASPAWGGTAVCGTCHDTAPLKSLYGSHDRHTDSSAKSYSCSVCHNGIATGNEAAPVISSTALHANFAKNVAFDNAIADKGLGTVASFDTGTKQCSGTYCHGDFTGGITSNVAEWDAPQTGGACGDCHNATAPTTNSHTKHVGGGGTNYSYACSVCHSVTTHSNGIQGDISFDSKNSNGTYSAVTKTCANLYCHGNTTGAGDWTLFDYTGSAKNNDPKWTVAAGGGPGSVACGACHDASATLLTTGRHDKHIGSNSGAGKYNYTCHKCHESVITEGGALSTTYHANRSLEVKMDADTNPSASAYNTANNTCAGTYCHGNFNGGNASTVADWDLAGAGSGGACGECHSLAPSKSNFGAHDKHTDASQYNYDCSDCHNGIAGGKEGGSITLTSIVNHANFTVNVSFSAARADKPGSLAVGYDSLTFTCTNTYCHGDFAGGNNMSPTWTNTSTASCGSCHNNSPDNGSDSGSHNIHTNAAGYNYDCAYCHYTVASGTESGGSFTVLDKTKHVNFQDDVIFDVSTSDKTYGANPVAGYNSGTRVCSNTYCHGDLDGGKRANTAAWGTASTGACGTCHDNAPAGNSTPAGFGSHDRHTNITTHATLKGHQYNCSLCHGTVTDSGVNESSTFNNSAFGTSRFNNHANGTITISFTGTADKAPDTKTNSTAEYVSSTCSNVYCHGDFDEGKKASPAWTAGTTAACGTCHDTAPANGSDLGQYGVHDRHTNTNANTGYNYSCQLCHNGTVQDETVKEGIASWDNAQELNQTARWESHLDGIVNVSFSGIADQGTGTGLAEYQWNGSAESTKTCRLTYCHGDFAGSATNLPNVKWNEGNDGLNGKTENIPAWITIVRAGATPANCGTCHGMGANADLGIPTANNIWESSNESHSKHSGYADATVKGYQYPCGFCHYDTVNLKGIYDSPTFGTDGVGSAYYDKATRVANYSLHANGKREYPGIGNVGFYTPFTTSGSYAGGGSQTGNCSNLYCHSDGWSTSTPFTYDNSNGGAGIPSPVWGGDLKSSIATCKECHNSSDQQQKSSSAYRAPDHCNGMANHFYHNSHGDKYACVHCHDSTTTSTDKDNSTSLDTIVYSNNRHVNRWMNVRFDTTHVSKINSDIPYIRNANGGGNCSNLNCHKDHSPYTSGESIFYNGCGGLKANTKLEN